MHRRARRHFSVLDYDAKGKYLAAICAAPTVFGEMGILNGKKATCYPGLESGLVGAEAITDGTKVVVDGAFTIVPSASSVSTTV